MENQLEKCSLKDKDKIKSAFKALPISFRQRRFFSSAEEKALLKGVQKYQFEKCLWRKILSDPELGVQFKSRTNVDLKDKWRNLVLGRYRKTESLTCTDIKTTSILYHKTTKHNGVTTKHNDDVTTKHNGVTTKYNDDVTTKHNGVTTKANDDVTTNANDVTTKHNDVTIDIKTTSILFHKNRKVKAFTHEEEKALLLGMKKHSKNKMIWSAILKDDMFKNRFDASRTTESLRGKFRRMVATGKVIAITP